MHGRVTIVRMHVHRRPRTLELMLMHAISARLKMHQTMHGRILVRMHVRLGAAGRGAYGRPGRGA